MKKSPKPVKILKPKVCCISDLHFGVHGNSEDWHNTAIDFAKWLKVELKEKNIKDIIICGDVFHNRNEIAVNTLNCVTNIFKIWSDFNIIITVGNHDAFFRDRSDVNSINILNGWNNITVVEEMQSCNVNGETLTFCPWGTEVSDMPKSDIIFGHFEINTFKMNNYRVCEKGIDSDVIFDKTSLVITGHFHIKEDRKYKNGRIVYLGSPYEMDWNDFGTPKGYHILDVEEKELEFFQNHLSPKHTRLRLSTLSKEENLKEKIKNNIVEFIVDKKMDSDKLLMLLTQLSSFEPFSFKPVYNIEEENTEIEKTDFSVNIKQAIPEFIAECKFENGEEVAEYVVGIFEEIAG